MGQYKHLIFRCTDCSVAYAATQERSHRALLKELVGLPSDKTEYGWMSTREKLDFGIIVLVFGVQAGAYVLPFFFEFTYLKEILRSVNTFSILTSQYFSPQGYSDDTSGFMGATMLLAGIISSAITSPLFDRVLTRHLGRTNQILVPILSAAWVSLIWAGKPPDSLVLHIIFGSDPPLMQLVQTTPPPCSSSPRSLESAESLYSRCPLSSVLSLPGHRMLALHSFGDLATFSRS